MCPPVNATPAEIEWLRRVHAGGAVIASVCSGSLILAHSGLLDGLEATGHWAYRQLARQHYPRVRWREESVLARADGQRIVTAGGVTAWQDLALHLISRLCSPEHAARTAKVHLLALHTDGQMPFAVLTQRAQRTDAVIGECQIWLADHYAEASPSLAWLRARGSARARLHAGSRPPPATNRWSMSTPCGSRRPSKCWRH